MRQPYRISGHVGALIHDVARIRRTVVDKVLSPLSITRAQRWVLIYLSQLGDRGISQRELAEVMTIGQVAIGERLAILEAAGCIERKSDPQDRRQKLIVLSDRGYSVLQRSREYSDKINEAILEGIPADDLAATQRTLETMRANLMRVSQTVATTPDPAAESADEAP